MSEPTFQAVVVAGDAELREELCGNLRDEGFAVVAAETGDALTGMLAGRSATMRLFVVDFTTPGVDPSRLAAGLLDGDLVITIPVSFSRLGKEPMEIEDLYDCARLFQDGGSAAVADRGRSDRATWRRLAAQRTCGDDAARVAHVPPNEPTRR